MNTLIVYASKYGSTEKCARILAEKLNGEIDLCNLKIRKVIDLSEYDNVIIGSSIYVGKIQKVVNNFCLHNMSLLKEKKLGLFICCMRDGDIAITQLTNSFPDELLSIAIAKDFFGGEFRFSKMNFMEKFIVKKVTKEDKSFPAIDTDQDLSTIVEERINSFAQLINKA